METRTSKIVVVGRRGSGKSSMLSILFNQINARDCWKLKPTEIVEEKSIYFFGNLSSVRICEYPENILNSEERLSSPSLLLENNKDNEILWTNITSLIHVIDLGCCGVVEVEMEEYLEKEFKLIDKIVAVLRQYSPECTLFVLLNKFDLLQYPPNQQQGGAGNVPSIIHMLRQKEGEIRKRFLPTMSTCYITSIFDESLCRAWSAILATHLLPPPTLSNITAELSRMIERVRGLDEVIIFEGSTLLMATHVSRRTGGVFDLRRFERISRVIRRLRESMGKTCGNGNNNQSLYLEWREVVMKSESIDHGEGIEVGDEDQSQIKSQINHSLLLERIGDGMAFAMLVGKSRAANNDSILEEDVMVSEVSSLKAIFPALIDTRPPVDPHML